MGERSAKWLFSLGGSFAAGLATTAVVSKGHPDTSLLELAVGGSIYAAIGFALIFITITLMQKSEPPIK